MGFFKKLFAGTPRKAAQITPPPSKEEFDAAERRLKDAVGTSPDKASLEIATAATELSELFSKRGDYFRATGEAEAFATNTAVSLNVYNIAAQANYFTGWTGNAIKALTIGLLNANEALRTYPESVHAVEIATEKARLDTLFAAYEPEQHARELAVATMCSRLKDAAIRFTSHENAIWNVRGLKAYILALGETIGAVSYAIAAPGVIGPYYHVCEQDESVFWELASLLGWYFSSCSLAKNSVVNSDGDTIMSVAATIWPPSDRIQTLIQRFSDLMSDPQEMKDRRILWFTFPGATDDSARNVVYEYIVNELIGGPALDGDASNPEGLDPATALFMKRYMQAVTIENLEKLRVAAAGL